MKPSRWVLLLLLLAGDVETNPGPPSRAAREPKPDPKKIMEDKVNSHDEKINLLEKIVEEQKNLLEEMGGKQVELQKLFSESKVELERAGEENKKKTEGTVEELRDDIQIIKNKLDGGFSQLGDQTSGTNNKIRGILESLEEVQDKLWELDKSWENNLVVYGLREEQAREETSAQLEAKIRDVIRTKLGVTREVPILRVKRSFTGTNVRGSKPVTVYFSKYEDKEEILRKSKFLAGSNIYITEDFSKRVKDRRTELQKFMKKLKKRQPLSKYSMRYDKLLVDKDIYAFNEGTGLVELLGSRVNSDEQQELGEIYSSPTTPHRRKRSSGRKKNLEKSFSTDSALNHLVLGPVYDTESREPSPTKSITPVPEEAEAKPDPRSRPGSPDNQTYRGAEEENETEGNGVSLGTINGHLRKSNPDIPETIAEDE